MKKWECTVCGYIHEGPEPPDECPVCGADKSQFIEVTEEEETAAPESPLPETEGKETTEDGGVRSGSEPAKKWECTVCGYIHEGPEPPDECPVCGADKSQFIEVVEAEEDKRPEPAQEADSPKAADDRGADRAAPLSGGFDFPKLYATATQKMTELHAHPISVHIPNGVLPVAVLFLLLASLFGTRSLDTAAFCNLLIVLLAMPAVLFSGYNDWQRRYGGRLTQIFKVKIACGGVVSVTALVLVIWWLIQPSILLSAGSGKGVFIFIALVMLAAAITAGFYGGKLVFFYMSDKKKKG